MDLQTAMDASEIAGVLLKIDSPGGALTGFAEFAGALRASSTRKRVEAYVGGEACSGAYWLASATSRITVDPTARLGSIGVVIGHVDRSGQDEARGVRKREVVSSQGPQKRADPSTDDGRAIVQQLADRIAAKFIETVAGYRGVSVAHVMAEFGQGGVKVGSDAVAARMADEVGSFESTLAAMRGQLRKPVTTPISSHNPSPRTGIMPSRPTTAATDPHELAALEWRSSPKLQAAFPVLGEYLAFRERGGTGPAGKIDRGAWEREQFAAEYAAHPALAKSFPIVGDYVRFRSNGGRAPSV